MVKVRVALPLAPLGEPPVTVAEVPPTVTVMVAPPLNPAAEMVALEATAPEVGLRPLTEAVTVKLALAVLEAESVTATVWAPAVVAGTVKVAPGKVPLASVGGGAPRGALAP